MFAMGFFPRLRFFIQRLLQNSFVQAILFRGLWRFVRIFLFRRLNKVVSLQGYSGNYYLESSYGKGK